MPFTVKPLIKPLSENRIRTRWRVIKPANFHSERTGKNYVVPAGTVTDLASGLFPSASGPSILHDHLYGDGKRLRQVTDRREADEIYFEAMESEGVPMAICWAHYLAVRWFGARYYKAREMK